MTSIPNNLKTEQMKKGTTLWYRLGVTEEIFLMFWEKESKKPKRPDSMFDTVSMMDVTIQRFWLRIQEENKKLGKLGISNKRSGMTKGMILQQNRFF